MPGDCNFYQQRCENLKSHLSDRLIARYEFHLEVTDNYSSLRCDAV
jgi:hypothetical protein